MASGKRVGKVTLRILLLFPIFFLALILQDPFYYFLINILGYQEPPFFFINLYFFGLGWTLSWTFWSGLVYGAIGKRMDLYFITAIFCLSLVVLYLTDNVTTTTYLGLAAVAALGGVLGYTLKVGRQNWFGR